MAVVVAMPSELRPIAKALGLRRQPERVGGRHLYSGPSGRLLVVACPLGVGPAAARRTLGELLDARPISHVVMAGVAGAVAAHLGVGDVVSTKVVVDVDSGRRFLPHRVASAEPTDTLLTSASLHHGAEALAVLRQRGVHAVDMETAAVAEVCESRGTPWSVVRTISDRLEDGLVDETVLALTLPDGRADPWAAVRFLLAHPSQIGRLLRLGRSSARALRTLGAAVPRALAELEAQAAGPGPEGGG